MSNMNELYHHGILGMKWGVRRFQNSDGSLTSAGKKRYNSKEFREKLTDQYIKGGKDKPNVSPLEQTFKQGEKIVDSIDKGVSAVQRLSDQNKPVVNRAAGKTDEELQKAIKRLDLERRYNDLTSEDTAKGYDTVKDILAIVGGVVGIGAGASTIYSTFKNM